jgi:tetratricopeptide (TPR) repeat protein
MVIQAFYTRLQMKTLPPILFVLTTLPLAAQSTSTSSPSSMATMSMSGSMTRTNSTAPESLGTVSFAVSCSPTVQSSFNRGVALLHDFWYEEAQNQFEQIVKADPGCSMAYWGEAMASFHQIWDRPDAAASALAWAALEKAPAAKTERERSYIAALSGFFKPGPTDYRVRIEAYSAAMGQLYKKYPDDVDAGAFYALSLLAAHVPGDTSLSENRKAMEVLTPLLAKYPDNPGVVHYIIHACDNPAMAQDGLAASNHYGEIAPAGAHAVHMPGHIYSRLGMWTQDIDVNAASVTAAETAEGRHESSVMDEPHSYDFLLYAYLQSAQDAQAQAVLDHMNVLLTRLDAMPDSGHMDGMVPYYRAKLPTFYALEMRDWKTAAALEPAAGAAPEIATLTYWARTIAAGRLHNAGQARADLAKYDALVEEVKKGKHAYYVEGNGVKIERGEMAAWVSFAQGDQAGALKQMREAADLQDKVGQGEVDIPAREMLADMLLEYQQPQAALVEYQRSLKLSPNRFNGLYNAGLAAERAGDKAAAHQYYATLLQTTNNGSQSSRPEFAHVKSYMNSTQVAER